MIDLSIHEYTKQRVRHKVVYVKVEKERMGDKTMFTLTVLDAEKKKDLVGRRNHCSSCGHLGPQGPIFGFHDWKTDLPDGLTRPPT
jgi:hypothetical protein